MMTPPVAPLERLTAIEEIKQLKSRYLRALDLEDWEMFASVLAPDVSVDFTQGSPDRSPSDMIPRHLREGVIRGADQFVQTVQRAREARDKEGSISMHHGHTPDIDILSPTTASGVWALEDMVFYPAGSERKTVHGFGFYDETYVKTGTSWKIASMRLRRVRVAPITE
jgi:hypothetical protein